MRRRARVEGDEGTVLVMALLFVTTFALLASVLFAFLSSSFTATEELSSTQRERAAAESGLDLAVAGLRQGALSSSACGTGLPLSALEVAGTDVSVSCTAGTPAPADPRYSVLVLGEDGTGISVAPGALPALVGDVWSNGGISAGTGSVLTVDGDVLARGLCPGSPAALVESGGDGVPECAAATAAPATDPGHPRHPAVPSRSASPVTVPACPTDPVETLVRLSPGRYTDAEALNRLFSTCTGRDFWFEPGGYLFDFADAPTASPTCTVPGDVLHRLCLTGSVVAGTPRGWDPASGDARTGSGPWSSLSSPAPWSSPSSGLLVDGSSATMTAPGTSATRNPTVASTSGPTPSFQSTGNAFKPDSLLSTLSFPDGVVATREGTLATSTSFSSPSNALKVDGGTAPATADVTFGGLLGYSASLNVSGYSAPVDATLLDASIRLRLKAPLSNVSSVPVTITRSDGFACAPVDAKPALAAATDASGYSTASLRVFSSNCIRSALDLQNASVKVEVNRPVLTSTFTVLLDGVVLDLTLVGVGLNVAPETYSLNLSSFTPSRPEAPTAVRLRFTHRESSGTNPRLVLSGPVSCTYPLTVAETLRTDTVDVSSCVDTAAELDGLVASYAVDRPSLTSASAAVDGLDVVVSYPEAPQTVTFSSSTVSLPDPVARVDSATVTVAGSVGSTIQSTLRVTAGDGTVCSVVPFTPGTPVDVTGCLSSAAKVNGASLLVSYTAIGVSGPVALDGSVLSVDYRPVADRLPALGSGCDPTAPGVQLAFVADSRLAVTGGAVTLCAGPATSEDPAQVALHFSEGAGCTLARTCAALETVAGRGQLSVHGGVYAPEGLVSLGDVAVSAPLVTTGIVAHSLSLTGYGLAPGFAGSWISGAAGTDAGFEVTLVASVVTDGTPVAVLRQRVSFGPRVRGRDVDVLEWVLL